MKISTTCPLIVIRVSGIAVWLHIHLCGTDDINAACVKQGRV